MDKSFFIGVACMLMVAGLWLFVMDYFANKMSKATFFRKSDKELAQYTDDERKRYEFRKRNKQAIQAHRFRKGGYVVMSIGAVLLAVFLILPAFSWIPNQDSIIFKIANLARVAVQAPWGRIIVVPGAILMAVGGFCIVAGREHWKLRRAYARAILCFILGFVLILGGIFQWWI